MLTHPVECLQSKDAYFIVILVTSEKFSTTKRSNKMFTNQIDIDERRETARGS